MIDKLIVQFFQLYFWLFLIGWGLNLLTLITNYSYFKDRHYLGSSFQFAVGLALWIISWKF